jgi:hypothetical protein
MLKFTSLRRPAARALLAALGVAALFTLPAQAGEIYGQFGLPGIGLGYAHPLNANVGLRGDVVTLGSHKKDTVEEGIAYTGTLKATRVGLYADWFPFGGTFRLTGGLTNNNFKIELDASGAGGSITVGNKTYPTTAADGLNVQIKFPTSTPYLGLGWGHGLDSGLRFSMDLGASIGRAKLTAVGRGQLATAPDAQANIDAELAQLREGVGKVRVLPQLSLGLGYSF